MSSSLIQSALFAMESVVLNSGLKLVHQAMEICVTPIKSREFLLVRDSGLRLNHHGVENCVTPVKSREG